MISNLMRRPSDDSSVLSDSMQDSSACHCISDSIAIIIIILYSDSIIM